MPTNEAIEVHVQTLYDKIEQVDTDCKERDKSQLEATMRVHKRIDDFVGFMSQVAEVNRDVQNLMTHQKTLEAEQKSINSRLSVIERATESNTDTNNAIKKLAWAIALPLIGLCAATFWQLIVNAAAK